MTCRVFISYRRQDQEALAHWLQASLAGEVNDDEIFLDRRALKAGDAFFTKIEKAIESAMVFVALIGPQWNPPIPSGGRRLDQSDDPIRRELACWFRHASSDADRQLVPVLFGGAMIPARLDLPEEIRPLTDIHAFPLPSTNYRDAVAGIVDRIVAHLDEIDPTPAEEKWITVQLAREVHALGDTRIRQLGKDLSRQFHEVTSAPESARALARAIYRVGSPALQFLLELGRPDEQMHTLLELLATNWIDPHSAGELRSTFADGREGRIVGLECVYPDFTPDESLLKASQWPKGWVPTLRVNPKDPPDEIIRQIHDDLVLKLAMLNVRTTAAPSRATVSEEERIRTERAEICALLAKRSIDKRSFPYILHADHLMAADGVLIPAIEAAFPPLHILVATGNAEELEEKVDFAAIVAPSEDDKEEKEAFAAYATAHELIGGGRRKRT